MKKLFTIFLSVLCINSFSQSLNISGNVQDTIAKEPLKNAIVMAVKLMDSTLVDFTRTDDKGLFKLKPLPIDTYQVIISHPKFADQGYFIFGDKKNLNYDFGKIILQPKNVSLDEVTIFAFKDPIYYKGDTLVYTADSFKVKANATVEDLLKKLPGLKVDKDGKITSQGKAVDKVLVDGDEFFGSDPTVATKNLNASSIESVQVYEKKSDDAANSTTGEETQKILNLKLKDEAKKGYFGKVSGASDFQKFYEGEVLANYFKKKLKVSVFGLASNTPRSSFGWGDMFKYGLNNEMNMGTNDNGDNFYYGNNNPPQGIPQTLKSGLYYTDKISKKTKIGFNYSYNASQLNAKTTNNSQYFLTDTSYSSSNVNQSLQKNEAHSINFTLNQEIDSLTELSLNSKIKFLSDKSSSSNVTDFVTSDNIKTRNTSIANSSNGNGYDISNNLKLLRKFKKKDRLLTLNYNNTFSNNESNGLLKTDNSFYLGSGSYINSINQKKTNVSNGQNHFIGGSFMEPLTKKIKMELSYDFMYYRSTQNKKSLNNIGGEYTLIDSTLTNNFINTKQINRAGLKFIYEVKKLRFTLGTKVRNVYVKNNNIFKNQQLTQNFNNILPFSSLRYKFSDNKSIDVSYRTNSTNPSISQLQPIPDNTNPNFINIGNPGLLPTFNNEFNLNFNSWKPISGKYTWFGLNYDITNNDFSNRTYYDSIGRSVSQTINVNGNQSGSFYFGTSIPFFSKKFEVQPNANGSISNNKTIINNQENKTQDIRTNIGLELRLNFEKITAGLTGYAEYNQSSSTLNTNSIKPYTAQGLNANIGIDFPKKIRLESDAAYTLNAKRSNGYNINYLVWNASLAKTFFKKENLIVGFYAYDMLNQNISVNRSITSNIISDTKTNIISRYFLLKATFKFNSNKVKEEGDYD
ncbi:MAG: TonB-dependent receptor [Bacteroidota bacterium]